MREIKFRAWDLKNKSMLEIFDNTTSKNWFLPNATENFEIMQFTGLKDKNGKDIYEGDIIKEKQSIGKIVFENGCFIIEWIKNKDFFNTVLERHVCWLKIVGNIYETPLLVE